MMADPSADPLAFGLAVESGFASAVEPAHYGRVSVIEEERFPGVHASDEGHLLGRTACRPP